MAISKVNRRIRIRKGIRRKISGTSLAPRLSVYRSNRAIYGQLINDEKGETLVAASSKEVGGSNVTVIISKEVGLKLAEKAKSNGIEMIVFDRGGYPFHGQVKAMADGAREGGLKF
ncbi:MAG: 50S ribosomal protein L18 [Flammeovirgaceae bacterium]|mgnify:CR=1 FL=1|nr:50S ribosomal protein L18 [Flammeovirgaceae bacterium]|tara:strand:- start:562 stop:909 length:348 start_codon:yes stop_codon:yes gene_type:complete